MSSAHIEGAFVLGELEYVDGPAGVLLEGERLEDHEVARGGLVEVDQLVDLVRHLEEVGVGVLADLALKRLPVHRRQVLRVLLYLLR